MKPKPTSYLPRPRLMDALDGPARLVLISGPAGAGKTVLLDQWCAGQQDAALCRVALEDVETRFWQPLLRSLTEHGLPLQTLTQRLGRDQLLGTHRINELAEIIAASGHRLTVVVDGYDLVSPALGDEVEALLGNADGSLRLVLSTRVDPALHLYRARLDGTLSEIRAADLAFTDEEASALLARCETPLPRDAALALNARMGGWATGLGFAARALAHHVEPSSVVTTLFAADIDITEYLLHEVLDVQQPETRDLLLRTCVPDTLSSELAEDLVGQDGVRRLAGLEQSNLFLERADEGCMRYPPFFRDLLRAQLASEHPRVAARLHRRVASWYREHEEWELASVQLATGGLWEDLAEQLVDDFMVARLLVGEDDRLWHAARRIPADILTPKAYVVRAALALVSGDTGRCAEDLDHAREAEGDSTAQSAAFSWSEAVVTAVHAASSDRVEEGKAAVLRASRALTAARSPAARLVSPEVEGLLQVASARLALREGELSRALASLARVTALPGLPTRFRGDVLSYRALAQALAGQVSQACDSARESLVLADDLHLTADRRNPAALAALALAALERNDLTSVSRLLGRARVCRGIVDDPVSRAVVAGALAQIEAGAGANRSPSMEAETSDVWEDVRDPWLLGWVRLQAAEAAVTHGQPDYALEVLASLTRDSAPSGDVVAATAYAELGRTVALARTLVHAPEDDPNPVAQVSRLLVEAVHEADRHSLQAAAPLVEKALEIASLEGIRRPFLAAPPSVARVLAAHQPLLDRHQWLRRDPMLPMVSSGRVGVPQAQSGPRQAVSNADRISEAPLEPLTPKELEVLGHLEELLTTQEIAQAMFVSVNTVRTHIRNILRKLEVHRRNGAVRRARELALLGTSPSITQPG